MEEEKIKNGNSKVVLVVGILFILLCLVVLGYHFVSSNKDNNEKPNEQEETKNDKKDDKKEEKENANYIALVYLEPGVDGSVSTFNYYTISGKAGIIGGVVDEDSLNNYVYNSFGSYKSKLYFPVYDGGKYGITEQDVSNDKIRHLKFDKEYATIGISENYLFLFAKDNGKSYVYNLKDDSYKEADIHLTNVYTYTYNDKVYFVDGEKIYVYDPVTDKKEVCIDGGRVIISDLSYGDNLIYEKSGQERYSYNLSTNKEQGAKELNYAFTLNGKDYFAKDKNIVDANGEIILMLDGEYKSYSGFFKVLSRSEVIIEEQYWEGECEYPGDDICTPKDLTLTGMLYDMSKNGGIKLYTK